MNTLLIKTSLLATLLLTSCNQKEKIENTDERKAEDTSAIEQLANKMLSDQEIDHLLAEFIPTDYSILKKASGDLNLDGIQDYLVVLKKDGEESSSDVVEHPEKRPLLIVLGNESNRFKVARTNENTVYCVDCGGMMGDPFIGLTIKNGYFSVEHYGGSSWRWTRIITYKYSDKEKEWFLHRDGSESFNTSDIETITYTTRTTKDFGKVKFQDFDIYKED